METAAAVLKRTQLRKQFGLPPETAAPAVSAHPEAFLLGPRADVMMIGGASIFACALYWMLVDPKASIETVAILGYFLSFVINFPHFMASYQILYGDHRKKIFTKKSFFWAAIVAPILIVSGIAYGISTHNGQFLGFMAQAMFLSVGWHYVKQIFGVAIVTSAVQKRYFGPWERNFILLNLFSVWALSWVSSNQALAKNDLDGIVYFTLGLPSWMLTAAYVATSVTFVAAAAIMVRKYILTGVRPAYSSLVGFASIYFWYLPTMNHPVFFYLIPFFHSLQYMLFIYAMKYNEATDKAAGVRDEVKSRALFMKKFWGFMALSMVLGALAFETIPHWLDSVSPIGAGLTTTAVWYFAFSLFINLHHYFIDNVIWRGDNEMLKTYLVQASQKRAHA